MKCRSNGRVLKQEFYLMSKSEITTNTSTYMIIIFYVNDAARQHRIINNT